MDGFKQRQPQDESFKKTILPRVKGRINGFSGRYVIIENDVEQCIFEIYAALALNTPYNNFKTS